jgi:hypothetical protein
MRSSGISVTAPSLIAPGPPGGQDRQPVKRSLGPQFLRHSDAGVDHEHHPEQRVLRRPDDQDHDEQGTEDRVEPRQHPGSDRHRCAARP